MDPQLLEKDPVLAEIVRRLVEAFRPLKIYLFGSMARGDFDQDSDYDLMVIVPDEAPPKRKDSGLAYEVLWGTGTAADVIVWTQTLFEKRKHVVSSLPATVQREGKLVYGT
jgi:predicted nucleotidyltransferase